MNAQRLGRDADWVATSAVLVAALFAGGPSARSAGGGAPGRGLVGSPAHRGDPHNAIIAVQTHAPIIALTFDDGPSPRWTPGVLAVLRANGARATFFVVGRAARHAPGIVRAELAAGHEIADHTWSHARLVGLANAALHAQIDRGADVVAQIAGRRPTLFRPPHGDFDARVSAVAAHAGLRTIGWNVTVERELRGRSVAAATRRLLTLVRPGSILLAHDGRLPRARTLAVIRRLLPALHRRGYRVVTVSALLRAAAPIASSSPLSLPTSRVPSPASAG